MFLMFFKKIHGKIHDIVYRWNLINRPFGKKVYLFGTPTHTNIGDSAIVIAETVFLNKCGINFKHIKELTTNDINDCQVYLSHNINKNYLISCHGGGNMGNVWYNEELFRYKFMDALCENPTIIFPQTVYYTDDESGKKAIKATLPHYNNHKNLTIVAREKYSYDLIEGLYSTPKKLLTPDIVLSTTMQDYGIKAQERKGCLLVFRSDLEKAMDDSDRELIKSYLDSKRFDYRITDMHSDCQVNKMNRLECVRNKMQEFVSSELVITDRLHGMIFAAITETPCIVFSNNNYKVKGTYEWIKYLPYIRYVENIEQAIKYIPELLIMKNCKFDNGPLWEHFNKLAEVIKKYVN